MSELLDLKTGFFATTNENGTLDYYYVPNGDWDNVNSLGSGKEHKCYAGLYGHRFLLFKKCSENTQEQHICMYNSYGDCLFDGPADAIMMDVKSDIFVVKRNGKMETKSLKCSERHSKELQKCDECFEKHHRDSKGIYARFIGILIGMVAVGGMLKCASDKMTEQEKSFQSADATYVGTAQGYALFDLDGDKHTIEAVGKITPETTDKLEGKIGLTAKISEWAEQAHLKMERSVTQKGR